MATMRRIRRSARAPLWTILYVVLAVLVALVVLQLLGVIVLGPALQNILYILAIFTLMAVVSHGLGLF